MFWKFGFHPVSGIDGLLDRDSTELEDVFHHNDLIQECKSQNSKLVDFQKAQLEKNKNSLSRPKHLEKMLAYLIAEPKESDPPGEEQKRLKYSYLSIEVFSCEIFALCDTMIQNANPLLVEFWKFLDKESPLNDLQASYFARVNAILLTKNTVEMLAFIKSQPLAVTRLLKHLRTSAISDMIMKLVSLEEFPEGAGTVKWLAEAGLISKLCSQLDPKLEKEVHITTTQTILDLITISYQALAHSPPPSGQGMLPGQHNSPEPRRVLPANVLIQEMTSKSVMETMVAFMLDRESPNSTSSLAHGISIIMELIRRYCNDIEQVEMQQQEYSMTMQQYGRCTLPPPSVETIKALSVYESDLLLVLSHRLPDFVQILKHPKDVSGPKQTTLGLLEPVGTERLKVCELFAELIHLQYLFTSSPLFEGLVLDYSHVVPSVNPPSPSSEKAPLPDSKSIPPSDSVSVPRAPSRFRVIDGLMRITEQLVDHHIFEICFNLFFNFRWNNFLHSVVYDMMAKVFNTYSFMASVEQSMLISDPGGQREPSAGQQTMAQVQARVKKLVLSIFEEGNLIQKVTQADKENREAESKPKGVRAGYMGHLTYVAEESIKLYEKCGADLGDFVQKQFESEEWNAYVSGPLKETKEREQKPLGGVRPDPPVLPVDFKFGTSQMDPFPNDPSIDLSLNLPVLHRGFMPGGTDEESAVSESTNEISPAQRFLEQETFSSWHEAWPMSAPNNLDDKDIDFNVGEAMASENIIGEKQSENVTWKADFEGAFGTQDLRSSLDQASSRGVSQDPPGEEWSDFTNAESS